MHNLKDIRKNFDFYKKKINERFTKIDLDKLILLDKKNREIIQNKEKLESEKKILSKNKESKNFEKSKKLSKEIEVLENEIEGIKKRLIKLFIVFLILLWMMCNRGR